MKEESGRFTAGSCQYSLNLPLPQNLHAHASQR